MAKKTVVKAKKTGVAKNGRKTDGTFASGNKYGRAATGRPPLALSVREQMKIRIAKDPAILDDAINSLLTIASDPGHPQYARAMDMFIKLNGNYDPAETRDVTPETQHNPLADIATDRIKKALEIIEKSKDENK